MPERPANEGQLLGFFIDEDLSPTIAGMLRVAGIKATSVLAEGRTGLSDEEQLRFAAARQLTLVTANVADYVELARQWMAAGREHAGMVFVPTTRFPRRDAATIARSLEVLANQGPEAARQLHNSARYLTRGS